MCTIALAFGLASMAFSAYSTYDSNERQNDMAEAQSEAAYDAALADYDLLNQQQSQINTKAAQDKFNRERQGMREMAMIRVAQGESGALGNSALRELNASLFQTGYDTDIIDYNRDIQLRQTESQKLATRAGASGRYNMAKANTVNPFSSYMQIGSSGLSGFSGGYQLGKQVTG